MNAFGVSRLRLSSIDEIPKGADIITLLPVNYDESDSTPGIYMAVDTKGNYFYIMACDIEGDAAKIFIASDPDAGAAKLAEADLRYIVTGGVVQDCSFMPFVSTGAGLS
ncbi:hypothetical protein BKA67DRAFT_558781 [Truncatella angustata]|uniref:Uncharacterized protein n=1 Tax=Truncatella angustata TaxID=152316 RepID=A0A9P9A393_9PEZI|nr:uncharacterized protein BKA67DRAFT_558781 [Truncatella angustata]KAH6658700.1 hypothetical protein BKA67DRAFT_558781 [Truncatella angustata]